MAAVLGIDVGTGSARAGLFDAATGATLATAAVNIRTWTYGAGGDFVEQSSEDIWRGACAAVRAALAEARLGPEAVAGVGFDATCSLVVVDGGGAPVSVAAEAVAAGDDVRNVIVWMDHRAAAEARAITATGHAALRAVGGVVSPEMEMPKIKWLRAHAPAVLAGARLFDLADYLTWRATGDATRSLCTLACKWNLRADAAGAAWDDDFLARVGLGDLRRTCDIGDAFASPGARLRGGLAAAAAANLGLAAGTAVGAGMIDAHAGGVGVVGAGGGDVTRRLALIAGTSCCHMASSRAPVFAPGVWGAYFSAMVPGCFLSEGGQTAAGKLLDFVVASHPAGASLGDDPFAALNARLRALAGGGPVAVLARHVHVDPDFYGNRAPLADAARRGAVVGLTLDASADDLAVRYLAAVQALCYQTRHILDVLRAAGHAGVDRVCLAGGLAKNDLFVATTADALGLEVALAAEPEAVLLGAACLGATAAGVHEDLAAAMAAMTRAARVVEPDRATRAFHDAKYAAFRKLVDLQTDLRAAMDAV